MRLILDGWPVDLMPGQTTDNLVRPAEILGIEVYPNPGGVGAPGRYRVPRPDCGVLMIWTR